MLNGLIRLALRQRTLVLLLVVLVLVLAWQRMVALPVEVLPDLTKPTVTILTEAQDLAPEEVETQITKPLEQALMGVTGLTRLRSVNDISLSLIFVEFDWGTDIYRARQFVGERLAGAGDALPEGVQPYMTPVASLMGNIMLVGLVDPTEATGPRELRTVADWTVAPALRSILGIAEVLPMGGGVRQAQVQPDPTAMAALGVSFEELREAAAQAVGTTTGGFLTESAQEIMVRNLAMTSDLDAIGQTVVKVAGDRPIRIGDVAEVVWGTEPMRGDAGLGSKHLGTTRGFPGVILSVTKSPGFDTVDLTRAVHGRLEQLGQTLPEGLELVTLYDQADFIELAIGNLEEALRDGALMVALVLFLFLLNVRVTFIALTAIPLSLGMTILVFDLAGLSVNSMTLGGLAVAIGMVVDDAIVDVENVFRRLRENAASGERQPVLEVIARASSEVRASIFFATLLIILVFVPLLGLSGVEGRLFAPIAVATIVSMAASFVVSLTVIPVLSFYLLRPKASAHKDGAVARGVKRVFEAVWLAPALKFPVVLCGVALLLLMVSVVIWLGMGVNFLPPFREPTVVIATTTAPGTSLRQTTELAAIAQDRLLEISEVETVGFRVGRAERGDHVVPVSTVEFDVEFDEHGVRGRDAVVAEMKQVMREIPGTFSAFSGPLADRIGHMLSGVSAKVAVKIYGPDLRELQRLGARVVQVARGIPGMEEAAGEQQAPIPQLRIEPDRARAQVYNVTPGMLTDEMAHLMAGARVGRIYEGERVYDLVVRLPSAWREDPERLADMIINTRSGERVPLRYVAEVRQASGPNTILRENTRRRFVVKINPDVADLAGAVRELEQRLADEILPQLGVGYQIQIEGEYQAQQQASRRILLFSVLILLLVTVLLTRYFRSFTCALLVLSTIPISMIGGVLLTRVELNQVSIATLVGFIAIAGIAARNSIMMISHYLHLMRHEGMEFGRAMVVRGTLERLIPVLMTALSAGIALAPLVLAGGEPGKEILNPVAVVIVGGLFSSTLLGLGITPTLFLHVCRRAAERSIGLNSVASH